ncbi:MAG: hypothetical protein K9L32_11365 [Chromatiaceae bacterium]|nr:hypothetical protein [Chromatiaceae bacterium]
MKPRTLRRVRASRLRVTTDLVFAMAMILALILGFLAAALGLLYWSKVDLGIDIFDRHLFASLSAIWPTRLWIPGY